MLKKLSSFFALVALAFAGVMATSAPANADPAGNDATLGGLSLSTTMGDPYWASHSVSLAQTFSSSQTYYDAYSKLQDVYFTVSPTDPSATVTITGGDQSSTAMTAGTPVLLHFPIAVNNLVRIVVTAADGVTTKTYKVNLSAVTMPQPELISYTPSSASTAGGTAGVAYVKHLFPGGDQCWGYAGYNYNSVDSSGNPVSGFNYISYSVSPADDNGVSKMLFQTGNNSNAFRDTKAKSDFQFVNGCYLLDERANGWNYVSGVTTVPNAFTFFNPTVSSVEAPATISHMGVIKVNGTGMNSHASLAIYLLNPANGSQLWMDTDWINDSSFYAYPVANWSTNDNWKSPAKVKLVIDQVVWGEGSPTASYNLYTQDINFTPELPTQVSLTPSKGPLVGGNVVKISGHHLCNDALYDDEEEHDLYPTITIGGQQVTNLQVISGCDEDTYWVSNDGKNFDALDKLSFTVPAGLAVGSADVTIDIGYGPAKAAVKYTYGAKPTVTAIAPNTVANTGGSVVTITGTNFGTSGTPIVIIDGVKSPYVQRISDSKLLAMVPADTATGAVSVNVISASGGGALDTPASLTLAAPSKNPTISSVTPSSAGVAGGDVVTIAGTGFDATATGVTIGGVAAKVTAATATSLTIETPSADNAGAVDVVVGTPTGIATSVKGFTYAATPGVTSVSPSSIKTTDTGAATSVTITGVGFGSKGTIKVGTGAETSYTATNAGTTISGVSIPNTAVGSVAISITPTGAKAPFTTSVRVNGPVVSYVGPNPYNRQYGSDNLSNRGGWATATTSTDGGDEMLIQGANFGANGTVKIGTTTVTPSSYTATQIVFTTPALAVGSYDVTVVPATGSVTATVVGGLRVAAKVSAPTITSIQSSVDPGRDDPRFTFYASKDVSDLFTITGKGFLSTDNGAATRVQMQFGEQFETIVPVSVTDTKIEFHAPRDFPVLNWILVQVNTATSQITQTNGIYYLGEAPQPTTMWPGDGLCTKDAVGPYQPASVTASGPGVFGDAGTVSIDGTNVDPAAITWTADAVTINFANLPSDLANPWGGKQFTFTPSDTSLIPHTFGFTCGIVGSVTTTLNGGTADLTIAAGTDYTAAAVWKVSAPNTTYTEPAAGYYYQSATDYNIWARNRNVQSGLPVAAGDWYVWANTNIGTASFDTTKYFRVDADNVVHLVITGNPVTITPKLKSGDGNTKVYSGQLGDGTNGSASDITYVASSTADPITGVTWQYRNHQCALNDPNYGWSAGLPNSVAISDSNCGGDGTSVTSWEIRVASFQMTSGGKDKSIYYLPTFNTFQLTITKKALTLSAVKVEKVYDGTTNVTLGDITVSGAIEGDTPTLDPSFAAGAQFADATVGNGKQIVLSGPFQLSPASAVNYTLSNPDFVVTGTIKKADATLKLTATPSAVILGNTSSINLAVTVTDNRTGADQIADAAAPAPVVVSKTPGICSVSGNTITPLAAGDCVIDATQAASTDYNAAVSYHDSSTTTEEISIKIYAAPKDVTVIADDIQVAVGESINPTYLSTGLLDGDTFDNVTFEYYQGSTLLTDVPTAVGTYKVVPVGGAVTAQDLLAYSGNVKYVAGKLVITAVPPVITASTPAHGPEAGGNTLEIDGTGLGAVTSITIGDLTIRKPNFVVNGDGTALTLVMPAGTGGVSVVLNAGSAQVSTDYTYDPAPVVTPPTAPLNIDLQLKLKIGAKLSGQPVFITGGGLKANSQYTLTMHSKALLIYTAITDADGNFAQTVIIPAKACLAAGQHNLTLVGTSPAGDPVSSVGYFTLDDQCHVTGSAVKSGSKTWTLSGFLFDFLKDTLTSKGVKSLKALSKFIKGAKTVTIYGYTETTHSKAVHKFNLKLSQGRCNTVMAYLKKQGINAVYVTVPKAGANYVSLKKQYLNRRVVITADF